MRRQLSGGKTNMDATPGTNARTTVFDVIPEHDIGMYSRRAFADKPSRQLWQGNVEGLGDIHRNIFIKTYSSKHGQLDACVHAGTQVSTGVLHLYQDFEAAAGGINDRAYFHNLGFIASIGKIGCCEIHFHPLLDLIDEFLRHGETHTERTIAGNPE